MATTFKNCNLNGWTFNFENGKGEAECEKCGHKIKLNSLNDVKNLKPHNCSEGGNND